MSKYEVWGTQGQGGVLIERFRTLDEAKEFAMAGIKRNDGSYAIKTPDWEWYKWDGPKE